MLGKEKYSITSRTKKSSKNTGCEKGGHLLNEQVATFFVDAEERRDKNGKKHGQDNDEATHDDEGPLGRMRFHAFVDIECKDGSNRVGFAGK